MQAQQEGGHCRLRRRPWACGLSLQSCLTLPPSSVWDSSPPGSSVHGILQARILEWVAMPSSRESSPPRDRNWVSCFAGCFCFLPTEPLGLRGNQIYQRLDLRLPTSRTEKKFLFLLFKPPHQWHFGNLSKQGVNNSLSRDRRLMPKKVSFWCRIFPVQPVQCPQSVCNSQLTPRRQTFHLPKFISYR